jgi:hypothetical protein
MTAESVWPRAASQQGVRTNLRSRTVWMISSAYVLATKPAEQPAKKWRRMGVGAILQRVSKVDSGGGTENRAACNIPPRVKHMNQRKARQQSLATSRVDQLVHAIALAMLRRQMRITWPRRYSQGFPTRASCFPLRSPRFSRSCSRP